MTGHSALHAGLMLTALPVGFGLAAVGAEKVLPTAWPDHCRCLAGALLAVIATVALAVA